MTHIAPHPIAGYATYAHVPVPFYDDTHEAVIGDIADDAQADAELVRAEAARMLSAVGGLRFKYEPVDGYEWLDILEILKAIAGLDPNAYRARVERCAREDGGLL